MEDTIFRIRSQVKFPTHGWVGIALILVVWPVNWIMAGSFPITAFLFFPLWVGYSLVVDGLAVYRTGTSLITRDWKKYISLFLVSAPVWWVFEIFNWHLQNWHYVGRELFGDLQYLIMTGFSFSTVIPAVFGTSELITSFDFIKKIGRWPVIKPNRPTTILFAVFGLVMFSLMMKWPDLFFPFLWLSLYFMLAPVNVWLGNRSLSEGSQRGDWRPVIAIWLGTLTCGFFWEMWNIFSYPKWVYTLPWANVLHVFEMPLLGYGGYLPFGMELFAIYHLVMGLLGQRRTNYVTKGLFFTEK